LPRFDGPVRFEDDGMLEDVLAKACPWWTKNLVGATFTRSNRKTFTSPPTEKRGRRGRRARPRG